MTPLQGQFVRLFVAFLSVSISLTHKADLLILPPANLAKGLQGDDLRLRAGSLGLRRGAGPFHPQGAAYPRAGFRRGGGADGLRLRIGDPLGPDGGPDDPCKVEDPVKVLKIEKMSRLKRKG